MILAVNIGNTNVRAATGPDSPVSVVALSSEVLTDAGSFAAFIESSYGKDVWGRLEGSIISTVVPAKTHIVENAVITNTGKTPLRVNVRDCGTLDTRLYDGVLGEDRAVCCAGALAKYSPPFILVDFGTSTTINVVNRDGKFLGGAIMAGVRMSLRALSSHTALLPLVENLSGRIPDIGQNTQQNLLSGAVIGAACAVESYAARICEETGQQMPVIVTGGHAQPVLQYCRFEYIHEPDLLLNGLFSLYNAGINN